MPRYAYECTACAGQQTRNFPMTAIASEIACDACGRAAKRVFTAPQLNCLPEHLSDSNRYFGGRSETDKTAFFKKWDKIYADRRARTDQARTPEIPHISA